MVIVDYKWYKATYGGQLDKSTFTRLASRAFLFADAMTEYRLRRRWATLPVEIQDAIKTAVCAFVDQAKVEESGGPVVSETNDGISRTFASGGSSSGSTSRGADRGSAEARLSETIRVYLAPLGLLYRGRGR